MKGNYHVFPEWQGGLLQFIKKEMAMGIEKLNRDNAKKLAKDPKLKTYESSKITPHPTANSY